MRRFLSIFGNVDATAIKQLFIKSSSLIKKQNITDIKENNAITSEVYKILQDVIKEAIYKVTGQRINFIIKHTHGVPTSPADITKFMDTRHCEGFKTRALFIDYIDILQPSNNTYSDRNDYNNHGIITNELRGIAGEYGIPVITITQGTRDSENTAVAMTNANVADSHKKVRYSDYIYMVRLRQDLAITEAAVREHVFDKSQTAQFTFEDATNVDDQALVPFEIKITKAKDGGKNMFKYHLFAQNNLRIYEAIDPYHNDLNQLRQNSRRLIQNTELLNVSTMQSTPVDMQTQNILF